MLVESPIPAPIQAGLVGASRAQPSPQRIASTAAPSFLGPVGASRAQPSPQRVALPQAQPCDPSAAPSSCVFWKPAAAQGIAAAPTPSPFAIAPRPLPANHPLAMPRASTSVMPPAASNFPPSRRPSGAGAQQTSTATRNPPSIAPQLDVYFYSSCWATCE